MILELKDNGPAFGLRLLDHLDLILRNNGSAFDLRMAGLNLLLRDNGYQFGLVMADANPTVFGSVKLFTRTMIGVGL